MVLWRHMGFSTQQSNNSGGYFILIPTEAPLGRKRNGEVFQPYHFKIKPGPFEFQKHMYKPIANLPGNYTNSGYILIYSSHNQIHTTLGNNCVDLLDVLLIYMYIAS